jgi:hypothetical protein
MREGFATDADLHFKFRLRQRVALGLDVYGGLCCFCHILLLSRLPDVFIGPPRVRMRACPATVQAAVSGADADYHFPSGHAASGIRHFVRKSLTPQRGQPHASQNKPVSVAAIRSHRRAACPLPVQVACRCRYSPNDASPCRKKELTAR